MSNLLSELGPGHDDRADTGHPPFKNDTDVICLIIMLPDQLPAWLTRCPQHCWSWLAPQQRAAAAEVSDTEAAEQQHQLSEAAYGSRPVVGAKPDVAAAQQQQPIDDDPPAKRARVDGVASCRASLFEPARIEAASGQLQDFLNSGDVSQVDQQLLVQVLSAAATAAGAGAGAPTQAATPSTAQQHLLQLQQQLGCLSVDACLLLLEELLLPAFTSGSSSSSSSAAQAEAAAGKDQQLPAPALAFFLQHAVLPQLQSLGAAAPKSMFACLAALGRSNAQGVCVLADTLLAPLVVSEDLLPVQVQLLVKLAKEADVVPPRLLDLLLTAALGQQPHLAAAASAPSAAATGHVSAGCCCWREPHASLLKSLLDLFPQHISQQLPAVVAALEGAVQQQQQPALTKSTVFGQLLMSLLKSFAAAFSPQQVKQLQGVVGRTSTFLSKALSSKLAQIEGQQQAHVLQ